MHGHKHKQIRRHNTKAHMAQSKARHAPYKHGKTKIHHAKRVIHHEKRTTLEETLQTISGGRELSACVCVTGDACEGVRMVFVVCGYMFQSFASLISSSACE